MSTYASLTDAQKFRIAEWFRTIAHMGLDPDHWTRDFANLPPPAQPEVKVAVEVAWRRWVHPMVGETDTVTALVASLDAGESIPGPEPGVPSITKEQAQGYADTVETDLIAIKDL